MVYLCCIASATKATCAGRTLTCGGIFFSMCQCPGSFQKDTWSKDSPNDELRASKTPSGRQKLQVKNWRTTGVEEDNKSHIKLTYLHSKTLYKDLIPWDLGGRNSVQRIAVGLQLRVLGDCLREVKKRFLSVGKVMLDWTSHGCITAWTLLPYINKAFEVLLFACVSMVYCLTCVFYLC